MQRHRLGPPVLLHHPLHGFAGVTSLRDVNRHAGLLSRSKLHRSGHHMERPRQNSDRRSRSGWSNAVELALFGHAFERLAGTLDPVLIVITLGRQELDHDIASGGRSAPERRRRVVDRLANLVLMQTQRQLVHSRRLHRRLDVRIIFVGFAEAMAGVAVRAGRVALPTGRRADVFFAVTRTLFALFFSVRLVVLADRPAVLAECLLIISI